ncbi:MAG: hypothetical protein MJ130_07520, partial [Lachnospiraceae bacterium]|nr:hypothetical protein [Lachnospiraceae bacterium]
MTVTSGEVGRYHFDQVYWSALIYGRRIFGLRECRVLSQLFFLNLRRFLFMSIFTGSGVAIITPMKANGEIDYP